MSHPPLMREFVPTKKKKEKKEIGKIKTLKAKAKANVASCFPTVKGVQANQHEKQQLRELY